MAGQVGDLVESALKRNFVVKDSGKILLGHGGVLDRLDSWVFVFIGLKLIGLGYRNKKNSYSSKPTFVE